MMDLSDGLAKDLPRLASKSRCGFQLHHQSLPLSDRSSIPQALNDGEDYELLFTSPDSILEPWKSEFPKLPLTKIGELRIRQFINRAHVSIRIAAKNYRPAPKSGPPTPHAGT